MLVFPPHDQGARSARGGAERPVRLVRTHSRRSLHHVVPSDENWERETMATQDKDLILLILDMQGIEDRLREFERTYRLRSNEFFRLARAGRIEQRLELIEWLGLYETFLADEREYRVLLERQVEPVLTALNSTPLPS